MVYLSLAFRLSVGPIMSQKLFLKVYSFHVSRGIHRDTYPTNLNFITFTSEAVCIL